MNRVSSGISILLLVFCFAFSGCQPMSVARVDEEREAYYMDAKEKLFAGDYEEAAIGFERALEVNPKNAAAHLELGLLHYEHLHNYVSAIYHFRKMLELRPDHLMAGQIKDHLTRCEMDFASSIHLGPLNQNTETRIRNLVETKEDLEEKVQSLEGQLRQMRSVLAAQSNDLKTAQENAGQRRQTVGSVNGNERTNQLSKPAVERVSAIESSQTDLTPVSTTPTYRKHMVRANDSFYKLSRKYGVTPKVIADVNPGIDSTKLQIGQVLNIPYPTATASR
ncbi:MAG: LysM peptidoglycan-binding domain-containing protein [Verrucomicrobia bacterium]|jgi:LysM repeat protein|nr:LysM peptidoglycan-binding domain-containing protein [Verrucomicrobiota bacterium]